jgi:hypothetical protein
VLQFDDHCAFVEFFIRPGLNSLSTSIAAPMILPLNFS